MTRATLANQEVIRARDVRIGDTVLVRRAGDVIPFVAGVLDAAARTGAEQEIVPPEHVPVVRAAADRAGQQPRALLHERHLPGADRPAADPLGLARRGRHRRDRAEVDRAPQRGGQARQAVRLLRAHPRGAARVRRHRRRLRRPHDRVDRAPPSRSACAARSSASPSRWPRRARRRGCAGPGSAASRRSRTPARSAAGGRGHRPEGRREPRRAPQPGDDAGRAGPPARARRRPRRPRRGPAAEGGGRRAARGHDGRDHRLDRRPALGREGPAPRVPAPVRAGGRHDGLLRLGLHRPADHGRRRRRRARSPRPRSSASRSRARTRSGRC